MGRLTEGCRRFCKPSVCARCVRVCRPCQGGAPTGLPAAVQWTFRGALANARLTRARLILEAPCLLPVELAFDSTPFGLPWKYLPFPGCRTQQAS
jgi:hypothetical protein